MSVKLFTAEEIEELRKSPYVRKVSEKAITYTEELKECFWEEYKKGKSPSMIMRELGFDPRILGNDRIMSIKKQCMKNADRPGGLRDLRKGNSGRVLTRSLTPEEEIQRLKHKIKYLEQENKFLKKIEFIDKKADRKQNQVKNSKSFKK